MWAMQKDHLSYCRKMWADGIRNRRRDFRIQFEVQCPVGLLPYQQGLSLPKKVD